MPNQAFFNLADKKCKAIAEVAIAEFANYNYKNASIIQIVKQAKDEIPLSI